jgi:hypothetical protein
VSRLYTGDAYRLVGEGDGISKRRLFATGIARPTLFFATEQGQVLFFPELASPTAIVRLGIFFCNLRLQW